MPPKRTSERAQQHCERLVKAREERQRVREITERGYSKPRDKSRTSQTRQQPERPWRKPAERVPLLLVDIGIGNRKERIAVYEGDRADTLARDFCVRHGLDVQTIAVRLQEEIERQVDLIRASSKQ